MKNFFKKYAVLALVIPVLLFFAAKKAEAASLGISPSSGTFEVGSTFTVSVFLNTEGEAVNTLQVNLSFPPDKLQLVPQGTGPSSIITVYTSPPRFDNSAGIIDLQGGVPGGINVSNGLVSSYTFRVKAVGQAILRFRDASRVLANDGQGTDVLRRTQNGVYDLVLPPPAGPIVVSETHPDQAQWYQNRDAILAWAGEDAGVGGYSYVLNQEPPTIPDDTAEGKRSSVTYKNLADGKFYFHIKALRDGTWGGTTHFALKIDDSAPAKFPVRIFPATRTTQRQPVVHFATTDNHSGLDHYELKIVPLGKARAADENFQPLFIEAQSPYILHPLEPGKYDLIVRAYDKAGNFQEVVRRLHIASGFFALVTSAASWIWFWLGALIVGLGFVAMRVRGWHLEWHGLHIRRELPKHLRVRLGHLKHYNQKYGKVIVLFLVAGAMLLGRGVAAAEVEFSPPAITTVSRHISNEEIFYVGGKTTDTDTEVIIYLQSAESGEARSYTAVSDKRGDWFYRHNEFLQSGEYLLWAQSRYGNTVSPPSPQIEVFVRETALQFGSTRISNESLYLGITLVLLTVLLALVAYIIMHWRQGKRKQKLLEQEIQNAELAIRKGFMTLRKDLDAELEFIHKLKLKKKISAEEAVREQTLVADLAAVERELDKDVMLIRKGV